MSGLSAPQCPSHLTSLRKLQCMAQALVWYLSFAHFFREDGGDLAEKVIDKDLWRLLMSRGERNEHRSCHIIGLILAALHKLSPRQSLWVQPLRKNTHKAYVIGSDYIPSMTTYHPRPLCCEATQLLRNAWFVSTNCDLSFISDRCNVCALKCANDAKE